MDQIKLYIFDLNGTICNTPFIDKTPLAILPGRKEKLAQLQAGGAQLAIASNQGGVAFGFTTEEDASAEVENIAKQLKMEHWAVAYGHPKPKWGYEQYGTKEMLALRKPAPGMLQRLMEAAKVQPWETMMIGDMAEDQGAAEAAQCAFCWTKDFFTDYAGLLWSTYQQYQALAKSTDNPNLSLRLEIDGAGGIGGKRDGDWISWPRLYMAPHLIETTRREWEEEEQERKRKVAATVHQGDDFDPFLDLDDLP